MARHFAWLQRVVPRRFRKAGLAATSDSDSTDNGSVTGSEPTKAESFDSRVSQMKHDDEKSSESTIPVIPLTKYIKASGVQVLTILQSAAFVIPVPMLQNAIGLALKIIELCEDASAVEGRVKQLQDMVAHIMIIVVAHVTDKNEEGDKEVVIQAFRGIEEDIKDLLKTLNAINKDLTEIKAQNRWVLTFYKDLNMGTLDSCMNRLSVALERFKLANDLHDSDLLQDLHTRLQTMAVKVDGISQDVKHVVSTVDNIQHNLNDTRQAFDRVMARVKRSSTLLSPSDVIRQEMPLKPEIFCGRESLVKEIAALLVDSEVPRVCLLGPGGMGKTSVALAVVESPLIQARFSHGRCIWVPCIGAISAVLLLEVLYVQLQIPGDKQVTLDRIIDELKSKADPQLILLDNFETPWNISVGQKEVEDILRQLAELKHVAIMVTMRGKYPPCENAIKWETKDIEPMDKEASFRVYRNIHPNSKDDPNVGSLLYALGYMPFAVTLMASLAKEGQSTAEELLEAWTESGPDIISDNPERSMNRSIGLSVESPLVQQNSNALLLLHILSLLPAGTPKENLRWWAPTLKTSMVPSAIAALSKAALLLENKRQESGSPILFLVPVVQSFMKQHNRIPDDVRKQLQSSCCQFLLHHATRFYQPEFRAKSTVLAAEDSNVQSILFVPPATRDLYSTDQTVEALIAFCWYRCDTKPSPELANYAVTAAEASGNQRHLALAEWCLGRTFYFTDSYHASFKHLSKARQLLKSPSKLDWRKLVCRCGIDLVDTALSLKTDSPVDALDLALEVEANCAALADEQIHGRSLLFVGVALLNARRREEALTYLYRAKVMLQSTGDALDIANVKQVIARAHRCDCHIFKALAAMQMAWEFAEKSDIQALQGDVALELAEILFQADKDEEAMKFTEIALLRYSFVGNDLRLAGALECLGYGYLRRVDYPNAFCAYESALEKYQIKSVNCQINQLCLERCRENLARITQKSEDPDKNIGFYMPTISYSVDPREPPLFYPSPPAPVPPTYGMPVPL